LWIFTRYQNPTQVDTATAKATLKRYASLSLLGGGPNNAVRVWIFTSIVHRPSSASIINDHMNKVYQHQHHRFL
jgi:hypothetical protein